MNNCFVQQGDEEFKMHRKVSTIYCPSSDGGQENRARDSSAPYVFVADLYSEPEEEEDDDDCVDNDESHRKQRSLTVVHRTIVEKPIGVPQDAPILKENNDDEDEESATAKNRNRAGDKVEAPGQEEEEESTSTVDDVSTEETPATGTAAEGAVGTDESACGSGAQSRRQSIIAALMDGSVFAGSSSAQSLSGAFKASSTSALNIGSAADADYLPSMGAVAPPLSATPPTTGGFLPSNFMNRQFSATETMPSGFYVYDVKAPHGAERTRGGSATSLNNKILIGGRSFQPTTMTSTAASLSRMSSAMSTGPGCSRVPLTAGVNANFSPGQFFRSPENPVLGLRPNKSRSNFAGALEDDADKPYYLKQISNGYGMAKHLHTEQVMSKHTLKGKMTKFQRLFDRAFTLINLDTEEAIVEGAGIVAKVMINAWVVPKIGHDLAYGLCDYLREMGYIDLLLQFFLSPDSKHRVRVAAGRALEECLSGPNRDYLVEKDTALDELVNVAKSFKEGEELRISVSLFESLFKQSHQTNAKLIEMSCLEFVLNACKATTLSQTFRHAALALANLSMYSENDCQQKMIAKNVPDWLFLLASSQDDVTRYYACLAICALVSNKEIEAAVIKSGTLSLVEPFLLAHKPNDFANSDYRHNQGRPREWLEKLIPMLSAKRREPRSMAAFHFAMEAGIKKEQDQLEIFEEIGAVEALRQVASCPEEVGPKFATLALEIIGAEVPYKLVQQVPLWSIEDVQYWVAQIGFENYAQAFLDQKVDGDLLLLLTDEELERDIQMKSGLLRKRFIRELDSLKMGADYSCVDETHLDRFLVSISPQFSVYTYQLLEKGADRSILPSICDEVLKSDLGIKNPIDRMRLVQALEECKHIDDMEIAILSRHIDIFISYRRSTGNQLASLIKVLLQLRGYKVFIDVDRLSAGKFDLSLLKNIQAAKHFVLVLTPNALQRCKGDDECHDWVHKEVLCALEHNKNVIPIFDPQFEWPDDLDLPADIRGITRFNGVRWVHEYQDACVDKLEKFIKGELNINRGFYPHQERGKRLVNFRSNSSKQSSNPGSQSGQITPSHSVSDVLLETLCSHRSRTSSHDDALLQSADNADTCYIANTTPNSSGDGVSQNAAEDNLFT